MLITMTQRQIEREAEKDLDSAEADMDKAEAWVGIAKRDGGLHSFQYRSALIAFESAIATHANAIKNLQKTSCEEEN